MATKKISLSKDQKAELEKLRLLVARRGLSPLMNGSLWRAALDVILSIEDLVPYYRLRKLTDKTDPDPNSWQEVLPHGLPLYNFIEWLEIKTHDGKKSDHTAPLAKAFREQKIPYLALPGAIRIEAYKK